MVGNVVEPTDRCQGCGKPLSGRQKTGCSARCRAEASRTKRKEEALAEVVRIEQAVRTLRRIWGEEEST